MSNEQEKLLIEQAKNGSSNAFEKLISMHYRKLFSFALSITGSNHAMAEDILQETLIRAFIYIKKFNGKSLFITWLWRIVRNEFATFLKKSKKLTLVNIDDSFAEYVSTDNSEQEVMQNQRKNNLMKLISKLPIKYSEVIILVDIQEMSHKQASEVLGIKNNALKVRLFRAKDKLSELAIKHEELFL